MPVRAWAHTRECACELVSACVRYHSRPRYASRSLGGEAPTEVRATAGSAEAEGEPGSMDNKESVKKGLRELFSLFADIHVPLFGMTTGPKADFGLADMLARARFVEAPRLHATLQRAFAECARAFAEYRTSLDAPPPWSACPRALMP